MDLAPYISIERCRLVKYDHYSNIMDESFDLDEVGMLIMIWRRNVGGILFGDFSKKFAIDRFYWQFDSYISNRMMYFILAIFPKSAKLNLYQ